jgi:predicted nucleic acid-binding Zn ribbon protein
MRIRKGYKMRYHSDPIEKICEVCSIPFITINSRQKYCSSACGSKVVTKNVRAKYRSAIQVMSDNHWKRSKEGIQQKFQELMTPRCQLCLSDENVVCKLRKGVDGWQVISPDSWNMLCQNCLDQLKEN